MAALVARPRLFAASRRLAGALAGRRWKSSASFLSRADSPRLAYSLLAGKPPGILFLPGLHSSMNGTKGAALLEYCRSVGHAYTRFDYRGCGASDGNSSDWGIAAWKSDVLSVIDELTTGPQIVVGSSLGAWLMVLAAIARPERVVGLVGVSSAPDILQTVYGSLSDEERAAAHLAGGFPFPLSSPASAAAAASSSPPGSASPPSSASPGTAASKTHLTIPLAALAEAAKYSLLNHPTASTTAPAAAAATTTATTTALPLPPLPVRCPVRLLHGMADGLAPWSLALRLAERLAAAEVDVTLRKGAGHRFSSPADLRLLASTVDDLVDKLTTHT